MKQCLFSPIKTDWPALNCLLLRNTYRGPSALPLTTSLLHFPQSQWWQDTRSLSLIAQPRTRLLLSSTPQLPLTLWCLNQREIFSMARRLRRDYSWRQAVRVILVTAITGSHSSVARKSSKGQSSWSLRMLRRKKKTLGCSCTCWSACSCSLTSCCLPSACPGWWIRWERQRAGMRTGSPLTQFLRSFWPSRAGTTWLACRRCTSPTATPWRTRRMLPPRREAQKVNSMSTSASHIPSPRMTSCERSWHRRWTARSRAWGRKNCQTRSNTTSLAQDLMSCPWWESSPPVATGYTACLSLIWCGGLWWRLWWCCSCACWCTPLTSGWLRTTCVSWWGVSRLSEICTYRWVNSKIHFILSH